MRDVGRWVAVTVLVAATLASGVTTFALTRVDPRPEKSAADRFAPDDGVAYLAATDESPPSLAVLENARFRGELAIFTGSTSVGSTISDNLGDADLADLDVWRVQRHRITEDGEDVKSTTMYRLGEEGIALLADHSSELGFIYDPPLLVLPADLSAGTTWTREGDALPEGLIAYQTSGEMLGPTTVEQDGFPWSTSGCLDAELTTRYFDRASDADYFTIVSVDTWCPGLGAIRSAVIVKIAGEADSRFVETSEPFAAQRAESILDPLTDSSAASAASSASDHREEWDHPEGWEVTDIELTSGDPLFGDGLLLGTTDLHPVVAGDTFAFVNAASADLTGADVASATELGTASTSWLAHPGDDVIAVGGSEQLVAVATADKRVVAFDLDGVRRWETELRDLSLGDPAVAGDGSVVIAALDGTVRVVETDGTVRWVRDMTVDVAAAPLVTDDLVIASDRAGNITAFDLVTGAKRWSAGGDGSTASAVGHDVVVLSGGDELYVLDLATGEELWSARPDGLVNDVAVSASTVIAIGDATEAYDIAGGDRRWSRARADQVVASGARIVVVANDTATLLDEAGAELTSWELAPVTVASARFVVATDDSIWIVGDGLAVQKLGSAAG